MIKTLNIIKATSIFSLLLLSTLLFSNDILNEVDEIRSPGSDFSFNINLLASDGNMLEMAVLVKDKSKSLVRYTKPERSSGRTILFVGRNMWIYIPGSRRAIRISPQQQIMGGISSADIARTVYSLDYSVEGIENILSEKKLNMKKLTLVRKTKGAAYEKIHLFLGDENRPIKALFFSSNGQRILKTAYFEGYENIIGKLRPTILKIIDHMNDDEVIKITYSDFKMVTTPEKYFQSSYLKRLK